jgi:hypothetical protein
VRQLKHDTCHDTRTGFNADGGWRMASRRDHAHGVAVEPLRLAGPDAFDEVPGLAVGLAAAPWLVSLPA